MRAVRIDPRACVFRVEIETGKGATPMARIRPTGERPDLRPQRVPLRLPGHEDLPQLVLHPR